MDYYCIWFLRIYTSLARFELFDITEIEIYLIDV